MANLLVSLHNFDDVSVTDLLTLLRDALFQLLICLRRLDTLFLLGLQRHHVEPGLSVLEHQIHFNLFVWLKFCLLFFLR